MKDYFYELAGKLFADLNGDEVLLVGLNGEDSDFVRFNNSNVRQAGSVCQRVLTLELIAGQRHARSVLTIGGSRIEADMAVVAGALNDLRTKLPHVPEDPLLLYSTEPQSGESIRESILPGKADVLDRVCAAGQGRDLVGIYAQGPVFAGFANSLGQLNWFQRSGFMLDWCFYHQGDKAVKTSYAGFDWDQQAFERKVTDAAAQLAMLSGPAKTIEPGEYRVYLSPAAMEEFAGMLCWGGFGIKDHRTKSTSLLKMIQQDARLHESVSLRENTADGMTANFQSSGYVKPDCVSLIEGGEYRDCLISPRSAKEYGVEPNGASAGESPESLDMAGGDIPIAEVLERLGTGIYVNQLWYLNYSDRPACRITGMTRFATFWVEDGKIVAPLNVMRFDETVYRVLGENLIGLTAERDLIPCKDTYEARSTSSMRLPGALVGNFRFTL